jgi:hypothetical protein
VSSTVSPDQETQLAAAAEPAPQLIVTGERVALGPLHANLVPLYAGWLNTLEIARGLGNTIIYTVEGEKTWYEEAAKPNPGQRSSPSMTACRRGRTSPLRSRAQPR